MPAIAIKGPAMYKMPLNKGLNSCLRNSKVALNFSPKSRGFLNSISFLSNTINNNIRINDEVVNNKNG